MGWNEDMQNDNIDLFTVIGELVVTFKPEDEFLDELYGSPFEVEYATYDEFLDDWYGDDLFVPEEADFDLSDQEYDDWADRDAHMTDDWDRYDD